MPPTKINILNAPALPARHVEMLNRIKAADDALAERFREKMRVNRVLDRKLVSFQANKAEVGHRWCKYREGFSAELIRYIIEETGLSGPVLDPFAGSGTALFVAAELGLDAVGIELLPCSAEIIQVRHAVLHSDKLKVAKGIRHAAEKRAWMKPGPECPFSHLQITAGAFPTENERHLGRFLFEAGETSDPLLSRLLRFAALSILEEISFTRKDGQYLRWDQRSGRCLGKKLFDKGRIYSFDEAIVRKLNQIAGDIEGREDEPSLFGPPPIDQQALGVIEVQVGSCLDLVPQMERETISGLVTSPPYCNRYDYTRTYALELAMLNVGEDGIRRLRQAMLSCTVENKDKHDLGQKFGAEAFEAASSAYKNQAILSLILEYLNACKSDGTINNPGIVRMVKNYFFELALLIFASVRVLKPGAPFVMVNDNVRYQGAHVPVDLILSDIAEQAGFNVESIWVLPKGKGNSSQQMGRHGRQEIRKCVYVWRKGK
jgi:DNA modification methylase